MSHKTAPELPHHIAEKYGLVKTADLSENGNSKKVAHPKKRSRALDIITWWWRTKWFRKTLFVLVILGLGAAFGIPASRYKILNEAGVTSKSSITVVDSTTQLPLGKVDVSIAGKTVQTDKNGVAKFDGLRLGKATMTISHRAYKTYSRDYVLGWGSNPLGTVTLQSEGIAVKLTLSNYISDKPVAGVTFDSPNSTIISDGSGNVILHFDGSEPDKLTGVLSAGGYLSKNVIIDTTKPDVIKQTLVPVGRHYYVSKASGKLSVMSSNFDGSDVKVVLAGTGLESASIALVSKPDSSQIAVVSTRDNVRDPEGYLLKTLTMVDVDSGRISKVDQGEQLQLINWVGPKLVYVVADANKATDDLSRSKIVAYDFAKNEKIELASAASFSSVSSLQGSVYYVETSNAEGAHKGLFKVALNGSGRQQVITDDVWTVVRTTYNTLQIQTDNGWRSLSTVSGQIDNLASEPATTVRNFSDNDSAKNSAWTELRDGKGTLLLWDVDRSSSRVIASMEGLGSPVSWSGGFVIFRVSASGSISDYIVSPDGGVPHKISDVSLSYGYASAY